MTKRKKIVLIIISIIVVLFIAITSVVYATSNGAPFASPYTKAALGSQFDKKMRPYITFGDSYPIGIASNSSGLACNILVYVIYAYDDYQAGKITQSQFLKVVANTKPSIDFITTNFEKYYPIVIKYPLYNDPTGGECYLETESDGKTHGNTVNYIKIQNSMFDVLKQMYSTQDPSQIWQDIQQFGVLMEMSTFFYSQNNQYGLESQINVQNFDPNWIINNVLVSNSSLLSKVN